MTNPTPLSPAAWAVDSAASVARDHARSPIAAALRAAADQVVPERDMPLYADDAAYADWDAREDVRDDLLAIAAELEDANG